MWRGFTTLTEIPAFSKYYLLTENREISDLGLNVLTSLSLGQYIKAEVWDFPVMPDRTEEVNKLFII